MDRLFGRSKAKQPPPNLTDCIANVSFVYVWECVLTVVRGDTKTYRGTGPYRAIQGPQPLCDWSVMGDRGGGATWTGECRLYQNKACRSSARTPSAAEIILLKFQTWLLTCEIKH